MSEYPEHDKLQDVRSQSQWLGEFIEWLEEKGMLIAKVILKEIPCRECSDRFNNPNYDGCDECNHTGFVDSDADYGLTPARKNVQELLAKYFEIDLVKLEKEKCAMLKSLRDE